MYRHDGPRSASASNLFSFISLASATASPSAAVAAQEAAQAQRKKPTPLDRLVGAFDSESVERSRRKQAEAAVATNTRAVGALIADHKCEEAKALALREGDFDLAERVVRLCSAPEPQKASSAYFIVAASKNATAFIDKESIIHEPNQLSEIESFIVFASPITLNGVKGDAVLFKTEFDCSKNLARSLEVRFFDAQGQVIGRLPAETEWGHVSTLAEAAEKPACEGNFSNLPSPPLINPQPAFLIAAVRAQLKK